MPWHANEVPEGRLTVEEDVELPDSGNGSRDIYEPGVKPSWKRRRFVFSVTMLFSAIIIFYVMFKWSDDRLGETLALGAFGLWATVVGAYAGFATYEDVKLHPYIERQPRDREREYDNYDSV